MAFPVILIVAVLVPIALILYVILSPRFGPHYTSRLSCPKCGKPFDYKWVPGGSLTTVRLGPTRYMRCPLCHEWSDFDIVTTRVQGPEKDAGGARPAKEW
jgi:hypothetical protein